MISEALGPRSSRGISVRAGSRIWMSLLCPNLYMPSPYLIFIELAVICIVNEQVFIET